MISKVVAVVEGRSRTAPTKKLDSTFPDPTFPPAGSIAAIFVDRQRRLSHQGKSRGRVSPKRPGAPKKLTLHTCSVSFVTWRDIVAWPATKDGAELYSGVRKTRFAVG